MQKKKNKRIKAVVFAGMAIILAALFFIAKGAHGEKEKAEMVLFFSPSCPHCHKAMGFLDKIGPQYPGLKITKHDVTTRSGMNYYTHYKKKLNIADSGVPLAIFGDQYELGFGSDSTTGRIYEGHIKSMLDAAVAGGEN
jgi:glutaredoxin